MARLVLQEEGGGEREFPVDPGTTTIGRAADQDIFLDHTSVSRRHARIDRVGDQYQITDLGSTNGTSVEGKRIRQAVLQEGSRVAIGELPLVFSLERARRGAATGILKGVGHVLERLTRQIEASSPQTEPSSPEEVMGGYFEQLQQQSRKWESAYRQLTVLYRIAYHLQGTEPVEEKLHKVLNLAIGTLRAERGMLFGYDPSRDELYSRVAFSRSQDDRTRLDWVRAVSRRVIDSDEPMASGPDLCVGPAMTRPPNGRTFICAPLRTPRGIHGSLYLDTRAEVSNWGLDEVEFIRTLAAQIGMTFDQEHFALQTIQQREIERELSIARKIQQGLLPEKLQVGAGMQAQGRSVPSKEVGGDYYDCLESRDGVTYWLLADVSGKGVPAALVQAQVRSQLRAMGRSGLPPEAILTELNQALFDDYDGRMFVTCVLGVVDPEAGRIRFVNAGHEFPSILRSSTGEVLTLEEGSFPCGLFGGEGYQATEAEFLPGDLLLLATDGIVDSQNVQGERFGPERFQGLLERCVGRSGPEVVETVFSEVEAWGAGAPQRDDITLLVLAAPEAPMA